MDEYVLQNEGQPDQMQVGQPIQPVDLGLSEQSMGQVSAQPEITFVPDEQQGVNSTPEISFVPDEAPMGSMEAVQQAASQASLVGKDRFKSQDPLVQQADFYLGPDSARKFQKYVAGNYEPLEDEDFTDKERSFLVDYENKRGRKVLGGMVRYGAPLAAGFLPGGQTLAGEAAIGFGSELLAQTLEPEKMRPFQIGAAAIPTPSIAKPGTGTGVRRLLTSETGVPQQATFGAQARREATAGGLQAGAQAGVESLGEDVSGGEIALRAAMGSTLFPAISTAVRGAGAFGRAVSGAPSVGKFPAAFAGEMQRPFTQKFLQDRADLIRAELGNASGIDPALSRQVADTFYNPAFSGSSPQDIQNFQNTVQSFLEQSVIQGRRSGLSGNDLTQAIVDELGRFSGKADVNPAVVESVVRQADALTEQATRKIDDSLRKTAGFKDERNRRALAFARRAEGRLQNEAQDLQDEIVRLSNQRAQLGAEDVANRTRIEGQIAGLQDSVKKIEQGFDERFAAAKPVSSFETGLLVGAEGNKQRKLFEDAQEEGFAKIRPDLKATTVQVDFGKVDKDGNPVLETKSLEDLRKIRSQIYRLFDFNAPVQQGFFESWEKLNKINEQMTAAFDQNPALRDALDAQNKSYAEGISRFKGGYVDKILRGIGEAGGAPQAISSITGSNGGLVLAALKDMSGEAWETNVKPVLSDYIYNQIRGKNPVEFLNTLTQAKVGQGKLSKEVANEFFPALGQVQDVASKYTSLINEQEKLTSKLTELTSNSEKLQQDVSNRITGSEKRLQDNLKEVESVKSKLADFQKKNLGREFKGVLGQPAADVEAQQEIISLLADIKSKAKKEVVIDDNVLKQIASNPDASSMLRELNDYVTEQAKTATDFQQVVNSAIRGGELYGNIPAGNIVDFLKSKRGGVYPVKRAEEFTRIIKANRPDLLADAQNIVIGRIVKDSFVDGKKAIDTNKMKALIAGGEKPGEYNALVNELFGAGGVGKISTIADQLAVASKESESLVSKSIVPTLATAGAYIASGLGPAGVAGGAAAGGFVGYMGRKMVMKAIGDSGESAVGRMLQSPTYVKTVTTPISQLTKEQIDLFNRNWSRMLKLETDRAMMQMEENQSEEKQLQEMRRQTRRRD
jgi:predicted  nucleic acid-binding Zn-ribbon protein